MKRKTTAFFVAFIVIIVAVLAPVTSAMADSSAYVSLGADLTAEQRATVLGLLGVTEEELSQDTLVTVTNEDEHRYLGAILPAEVIGTKALSSCKVVQRESGYGIHVHTQNVNYVTEGMFENALATAGMKDAEVTVAAPSPISGTAALVGAMLAYSKMNGTVVETSAIEAATNELVTSGELAEFLGDSEKTEQLIAVVKQIVAEKDLTDENAIRSTVADVAGQFGYVLSDEEMNMVVGLMKQLSSMNLDAGSLVSQTYEIYRAAMDSGIDLSSLGLDSSTLSKVVVKAPGLLDGLLSWFRSAFGG